MPAFVRPVDLKVDFLLRVSSPVRSAICEPPSAQLAAAVRELQRAKGVAQRVRWVGSADQADVRLCQSGGRLLLLDGSGSLQADPRRQGPAIDVHAAAPASNGDALSPFAIEIGKSLEKIGRVANLARLAAGVGSPSRMEIVLQWLPKCEHAGPDCSSEPRLLGATSRPTVRAGDRVQVSLKNPLPQPVDATVLYVDAYYGISPLFPVGGELPRIEPGGHVEFTITLNANPPGFEQMLVIAIPATPQSPQTSFVGLAQESIASASTRGGSSGGLLDMFEEAAFGAGGVGTTRGAPQRQGALTGTAEFATFAWTVIPR
jgi:hypothetical protein